MNPFEIGLLVVLGASLAVAWRWVDGNLKLRARAARKAEVSSAIHERVRKLEDALMKIPEHAADAEDIELLRKDFDELRAATKPLPTLGQLKDFFSHVDRVTLDVQALKEWQASEQASDEIDGLLTGG